MTQSPITNIYTLEDQIKDTIKVFGHRVTAKIYASQVPFTIYHFYAFGFLPRTVVKREGDKVRVIRCIV